MGCCLSHSTTTKPTPTPHPKLQNNPTSRRRHPRPPPQLEEETVKEVLTETSIAVFDGKPDKADEKIKAEEEQVEVVEVKKHRDHGIEAVESQSVDVEVSEITVVTENRSAAAVSVSVSVSESVSVGGEKRGEEVMSKSRDRAEAHVSRRQRTTSEQSPAKITRRRPYSGELTVNGPREKRVRSPAKKAVPSPEKKTHVPPRAVRGRSQSPATSNNRNAVNAGPARIRRDAGERSGRRSRSRSPARNAFQTSSSSSRSRNVPSSEVNGGVNNGQSQHGEVRKTGTVEEEDGCPAADESLDNPLVSLECFIFL